MSTVPANPDGRPLVPAVDVASRLLLDGNWNASEAGVREDDAIALLAQTEGIVIEREAEQDAVDAYRARRGLHSGASTRRWLEEHGLEVRPLSGHCRRVLEREALVQAIPSDQIEAWFKSRRADYDAALLSAISVATEPEAWLVHAAAQADPEGFDDLAWSRIQADATLPAGDVG